MQISIFVACLLVIVLSVNLLDVPMVGLILSCMLLGFGIAWSKAQQKSGKDVLEYIGMGCVFWFALSFGTKRSRGMVSSVGGTSSIQLEMALASGLVFFGLLAGFTFLSGKILESRGIKRNEDGDTRNQEEDE